MIGRTLSLALLLAFGWAVVNLPQFVDDLDGAQLRSAASAWAGDLQEATAGLLDEAGVPVPTGEGLPVGSESGMRASTSCETTSKPRCDTDD